MNEEFEGNKSKNGQRMAMLGVQNISFAVMEVPILDWLPNYTKELFYQDLSAGLTVFVFMVPQGMAYAILAGMPPVYGLYASTFPLIIYALLGTSRQLSIGPMAITSLLLGVACQKSGHEDESPEYIHIAMNVSMLVGLITYLMGFCRMGTLSNLISASVLSGFLTASALVIAVNQLKYIFGLKMPRFAYPHQTIFYVLSHLNECQGWDVLLGILSLFVLLGVRELKKKYKAPDPSDQGWKARLKRAVFMLSNLTSFFAIILGSIIARSISLAGGTVRIVGDVPRGMLSPGFAFVPFEQLTSLVPSAIAISFVAFAGNWAVAKKYAQKNKYHVDATQVRSNSFTSTTARLTLLSLGAAGPRNDHHCGCSL